MRALQLLLALILGGSMVAHGQSALDPKIRAQLLQLFPAGTSFSPKSGTPPHYEAFIADARGGIPTLAGYAFWTTEVEPLERGYDGPIKILVGMDVHGILTGILVVDHHEPYGSFSIEPPRFAAQFKGKDIRDPFRVGADIDAVSRASISIASATRAVRNSSRRVASKLLTPKAKS
jgi:NosR/NirI family transcriptional regulator, nitrous oxide reductase regulator